MNCWFIGIDVEVKVDYCWCGSWIAPAQWRMPLTCSWWSIECLLDCDPSFTARWMSYETSCQRTYWTPADNLWVTVLFAVYLA